MNPMRQKDKATLLQTDAEDMQRKLKELVERFEICWEVVPNGSYVKHEIRQTGFELELTATHEAGLEHPEPGCEHCRHVWRALKAVSDWIIPKEMRDSSYDVYPFDQTIQYNPDRKFRPEISLRICIGHRSGFDREVDACEVRCLNEMTQKLKEIGARKKKWRSD